MKYEPVIAVVICILSAVFLWWVFYLLWNYLMAGIFGLPELTFWQSVGLLLMVSAMRNGVSNVIRGNK